MTYIWKYSTDWSFNTVWKVDGKAKNSMVWWKADAEGNKETVSTESRYVAVCLHSKRSFIRRVPLAVRRWVDYQQTNT